MPTLPAPLLVLVAVVSVQFGGALAVTLLPIANVVGSVTLRLVIAAAVLLAAARPALRGRARRDWVTVAGFGATLGLMNLFFYASLTRLPVGVAVTIEFVGPLTLAAVLSRRRRDLVAVLAAALGVVLICGVLHRPLGDLDLAGLGLAVAAGAMWAAYILMSARAGARFARLDGLALAMAAAAAALLPWGLLDAGPALWSPEALWRGVGVALLSSVLPYSLELLALRRLTAQVFGILLSLEPAFAALAGLVVLGQLLDLVQLSGMALVVAASLMVTARRRGGSASEPPQHVALQDDRAQERPR